MKNIPLKKDEMVVVHVASYICRNIGFPKPPKRQVLKMVQIRQLMRFYEDDNDTRTNGELKWENDLAWAREELTRAGYMKFAERDEWELTDKGVQQIVEWAKLVTEKMQADATVRADLLLAARRINENTLDYLKRIANGESLKMKEEERQKQL